MKDIIIITLGILALLIALVFTFTYGFNQQEINECDQWQKWATEYRKAGFYITGWQAAQCAAHNIEIDAPVLTP